MNILINIFEYLSCFVNFAFRNHLTDKNKKKLIKLFVKTKFDGASNLSKFAIDLMKAENPSTRYIDLKQSEPADAANLLDLISDKDFVSQNGKSVKLLFEHILAKTNTNLALLEKAPVNPSEIFELIGNNDLDTGNQEACEKLAKKIVEIAAPDFTLLNGKPIEPMLLAKTMKKYGINASDKRACIKFTHQVLEQMPVCDINGEKISKVRRKIVTDAVEKFFASYFLIQRYDCHWKVNNIKNNKIVTKNKSDDFIIAIGTGRDGTMSLTCMINECFENECAGRKALHEHGSRRIYTSIDDAAKQMTRRLITVELAQIFNKPKFHSTVGNGFAFVIKELIDYFEGKIKLIHLKRDKESCVKSLINDARLFPEQYGGYLSADGQQLPRTTAVTLGKMSQANWDRLSVGEKFQWYYEETHLNIEDSHSLFSDHLTIRTEELSSEETRKKLGIFVSGDNGFIPRAIHSNQHAYCDLAQMNPQMRARAQWFFNNIDLTGMLNKPELFLEHFIDRNLTSYYFKLNKVCAELTTGLVQDDEAARRGLMECHELMFQKITEIEKFLESQEATSKS